MNGIPRRRFLKHAAAAGCLSGHLAAASGRIAIITGPPNGISSSEPVRWAAGELRRAVEEKGDSCVIVSSPGETGDFQAAVMVAVAAGSPAEAFRLAPEKIGGKPVVRASASDHRGLVYALTELADRLRHAANPVATLTLTAPLEEQPANRVRSICRAFVSDVEDKNWFYDRDYWLDYLSYLVTNRFNHSRHRRDSVPMTGGPPVWRFRPHPQRIVLAECEAFLVPGLALGLLHSSLGGGMHGTLAVCANAGESKRSAMVSHFIV